MKKFFLIFSALVCLSEVAPGATIARWTFETSVPTNTPGAGTWYTNIAAEVGNGTASGFHAGAATAYSNPAGNGSAESFSVNTWVVGDLFQFATDTTGFSDIGISFDQTSSGTGPGRFDLAYSTDGISFTTFASSYVVQVNGAPNPTWNNATPSSLYSYSFDLSPVSALDNAPTAYFRLIDSSTISSSGGTVGAAGTSRIDNFEVFAPVPEPGTISLLAIGGLLLVFKFRRK